MKSMRSTTMHRVVALAATAVIFAAACGGDTSRAEKSGGPAAPLTLRLGTVEPEPIPYAPYVEEFVRSVEEISGGSIDVEVAWEAVPWTPESEQTLATMVGDGDIDLALVPTRVWDTLGVTSMRALQAPFLVDSLNLLNTIVTGELADEMFAGLDPLGVEGLALWPDALRHPLGYDRPLLTAADFDGAQLTVPNSDTSLRLFRALGAEPSDDDIDGREAAFNIGHLYDLGTFTANITFYPKVNALVANADLLESLSDDQRDVLRQAAAETTAYAITTNGSEADLAEQYCAAGGSVALADAADVAELAELAEPVVAELEDDDTTNRIIDEIRELKAGMTPDPATAAVACGTVIEDVSDPSGPPSETSELPDGLYRVEISLDDVEAAGLSNADGTTGLWTIEVDDGAYAISCAPLDLPGTDCGGNLEAGNIGAGHLRGTGNTVWFVYDVEMVSELQGCQLPSSNEPGHCFDGIPVRVDWALDGDTLTFSNLNLDTERFFTIEPYTRIEGADQPDTEVASFPDGVYQMETSPEAIIAHGGDSGQARTFGGVNTLIFDNGTWQHIDTIGSVVGTYAVDAGRLAVQAPGFGQIFEASWTLDGDQLHFTDVETRDPEERQRRLFEWFWGGPWTRIDNASAPGAEEEPSASDSGADVPPEEVSELPHGVYRVEISLDEVEAAGQSNREGSTGIWTLDVDDGIWTMSCAPLDLPGTDCGNGGNGINGAGPLRGTGNTAWFVYDVEMVSELSGCQLPISQTEPGHCGGGDDIRVDWAIDGDSLTFSNFHPAEFEGFFTINPWTRIEGADQPDTEMASFPDGVYRMEVSSDELLTRGVLPGQARNLGGVNTLTFDNGTWRHEDPAGLSCLGTYEVVAGRVVVRTPCNPGNPVLFEADWTLDGDQLRFTHVTSEADNQAFADGFWGGQPWTRIDDALAPDDEEETADSGG